MDIAFRTELATPRVTARHLRACVMFQGVFKGVIVNASQNLPVPPKLSDRTMTGVSRLISDMLAAVDSQTLAVVRGEYGFDQHRETDLAELTGYHCCLTKLRDAIAD